MAVSPWGRKGATHQWPWCPRVINIGSRVPTIIASTSVLAKPSVDWLLMRARASPWWLLWRITSSGSTCTVATYRNVPALNNNARPVWLSDVMVCVAPCQVSGTGKKKHSARCKIGIVSGGGRSIMNVNITKFVI